MTLDDRREDEEVTGRTYFLVIVWEVVTIAALWGVGRIYG
jgi:hypothetical protein